MSGLTTRGEGTRDFTPRPKDLKSQAGVSGMLCPGSLFGFRNKRSVKVTRRLVHVKVLGKFTVHTSQNMRRLPVIRERND
jgi:hypothetical protein